MAVTGIVIFSGLMVAFQDNLFEVTKNIDIFVSVYKQINTFYVDEPKPGELMKKGIDEMLKSLDPYTVYYPESDIEEYRFMTTGQYGGIGALIHQKGDSVVIAEPYEGFPAQKAGLRAGDIILEVDGQSAIGKTSDEMSEVLKGEPGTSLTLTVKRPGAAGPLTITLTREKIKMKTVPYYGIMKNGAGYIKLNSFTETASADVKNAILDLKKNSQLNGLILDLRGNGGGLLNEAVKIVNLFVPKGTEVVSTKGRINDWNKEYFTQDEPVDTAIALVVLINGSSASASEIVAGAIQDLDRGVIVGRNSFGKGLVQQTRNLSYGSMLKLTVAKYYIPSGRCIQRLDYSNKDEEGHAKEVPDSLRKEFKTRNGRKVLDGAGIEPDIIVDIPDASPILRTLVNKDLIFDYATFFRIKHDSIAPPEVFALSGTDYDAFKKWLSNKDYNYKTKTEKLLEKLEKSAEEESYYDAVKKPFTELEKAINHSKSKDLDVFEDQIKMYLENEIISRYYYQKGRIILSLRDDDDLEKAFEILDNRSEYKSIIAPVTR